jgi:hypothetical protein
MRKQLVLRFVSWGRKLSVFTDESTSLCNRSTIVIYINSISGADSRQYVFLDSHELDSQAAEHTEGKLINCFKVHG